MDILTWTLDYLMKLDQATLVVSTWTYLVTFPLRNVSNKNHYDKT